MPKKYIIKLTQKQKKEFKNLSVSYMSPHAEVQRAKILLIANNNPNKKNLQIAKEVCCSRDMVQTWLRLWQTQKSIQHKPRTGKPRTFPPLVRAQITALACSKPSEHGKVWKRWSGEKLAKVAIEKGIVSSISASSIRRWLKAEKIKPWNYHSWQKVTDPQFVEKASPILDLYENVQLLAKQQEVVCSIDEKTSIQARQRSPVSRAAISGYPVQVEDRYKRMGCWQLFCALFVATGVTFAQCFARKCFSDFKNFLLALFANVHCQGIKTLNLIVDNGPTHAPKQLGNWIASLNLSFQVKIFWTPKHASWLNQVEIIFSKLQRDVLTPCDFSSISHLERDMLTYFDEINLHPKPIKWTYTTEKMVAKFGNHL